MSNQRQNLRRKRFGALEVLCFWGNQSGNRAWVYYCRICGHMGHRLGTHLVNGVRTSCPKCHAPALKGKRAKVKRPLLRDVALFFEQNPPPPPSSLGLTNEERTAKAFLRCLPGTPAKVLMDVQDALAAELEKRLGEARTD